MAKKLQFGPWRIYPTDPVPPIPGWQSHVWTFEHEDYDGPGDHRHGTAGSIEEAMAAIQDMDDTPEPTSAHKQEPALFDLAADLSRSAGEAVLTDGAVAKALERGKAEGREALAAALLSELDAARPDLLAILGPNGLESQVIAARSAWKAFADYLREWLGAGAPERPAMDRAWELINALGGQPEGSAALYGYGAALGDVLRIIEQLGGMDPARRKAVVR